VPATVFNNLTDASEFPQDEIRKVVSMAGVKQRHISDGSICTSDLCLKSARDLLAQLKWDVSTIDALILVTQTPDYFLPSTSCLLHRDLGLTDTCATFDVGLGCSSYPYGMWLASMMLNTGLKRVLLLNGETPSHILSRDDRATFLLFGDAGSATALERTEQAEPWHFVLHTEGAGFDNLIICAGGFRDRFSDNTRDHYLRMNGAELFNFTIKRVPPLINDTLALANKQVNDVDYYVFHQSNRFMMNHLAKKCGLPLDRTPIILDRFGNVGGPSVPLTITQGVCQTPLTESVSMMLLGYGVGLSWGSVLLNIDPEAVITHSLLSESCIGK
jgi:3-oxoacyl-[acyl-carrier-protein] synthase-3